MKEVQKDIYAKAETVKKLGEKVAELTVFNVTNVGKIPNSRGLTEMRFNARNWIKSLLEQVGSDKDKIENITSPLDNEVLLDLKRAVSGKTNDVIVQIFSSGKQMDRDKICKDVNTLLENYNLNSSRETLIQYLKNNEIPTTELLPLIDRLDRFIKEKTL
ncbi:MAG TPA: hypothetical protein ACFYD5_01665 [Candidatus Tripitaka sp. YC43]